MNLKTVRKRNIGQYNLIFVLRNKFSADFLVKNKKKSKNYFKI